MPALSVALLAASLGAFSPEDRDDSVDLLAPYLGLTPLDAEDLVADGRDDDSERETPKKRLHPAGDGPFWAALIPELQLRFEYHDLESTALGSTRFTSNRGLVLFVSASFGAGPGPRPARAAPPGVRLASLPADVSLAADPAAPSIAEVQQAAERAALVHLEDLSGWKTRARAAAWLPALEADYRRNVGEIDTLGVSSNLGIDSHNLEDVSRYGVRASWQLGQIVFSPEEVNAAQTALELQSRRQELANHVTELYFERLRLLAKLRLAPPREAEPLALSVAELTAKIDALTNGFLSQRLAAGQGPENVQ